MFLDKEHFQVGHILSKFSIALLSTLVLSILFFSPSTNASSSLDNFIADNNTTLAFNLDSAAPNEVTPEISKDIYEDSQNTEKTSNLTLAISIISGIIVITTPTPLIIKRDRSAHKQKNLKSHSAKKQDRLIEHQRNHTV